MKRLWAVFFVIVFCCLIINVKRTLFFLHPIFIFLLNLLVHHSYRAFFCSFVIRLKLKKESGMLQKTLGIVLHTLKYNDTSLIVDIYTEVFGRVLVRVKRR